jgi:hypothetical protein
MTLRKKGSRTIRIKNEVFRWTISPDSGYVVLVIENNKIKGSKIKVYIDTDINDFWVNFPEVENMNLKIIKPKDVEFIITKANEQNWDSTKLGKPMVFDLKEKLLIKRE